MAKLNSVPLYPTNLSANGIPVNLCKNRTPEGKFQIARVLEPGGPRGGRVEDGRVVVIERGETIPPTSESGNEYRYKRGSKTTH